MINVGSFIRTNREIEVVSKSTGRRWDVPKGRLFFVSRIDHDELAHLNSLDGREWAICFCHALEELTPLEQLAINAKDTD
ncbi:MAG: hypothetical protein MN733_03535 [Nitrososphaera sp.]|nr:hypothetical protein [Nitrososphaera sp.]